MLNKKVIIRAKEAGVFYGTLTEKTGNEVVLKDCRRLWYWDGANSITDLAMQGTKKPSGCKFTQKVSEICIIGVIEIIPCTEEAIVSIESVAEWKK